MNAHTLAYAAHLARCFPQRSGTTLTQRHIALTAVLLPALRELREMRLDEADRTACWLADNPEPIQWEEP